MMTFFAYIGIVVTAAFGVLAALLVYHLAWLCWRAAIQTGRKRAYVERHYPSRLTVREIVADWGREVFASYTSLQFGGVIFPWDVREPIRKDRFYGA